MSKLQEALTLKGLTEKQIRIADLVTRGLSNREISNQIFLTEKGVKWHLTKIYAKMNVKSRAQLIVWCLPYLGFVEPVSEDV